MKCNKNKIVLLILAIFFGYLGVHRFYAGKKATGFLWLFTLGLCGIGWIVDIVLILQDVARGKYEKKYVTVPAEVTNFNMYNDGTLKKEEYFVVGTQYYMENIGKLACSNPDWKHNAQTIIAHGNAEKKIFRYNYIYKPVKLIPEPENPHDKNAVYVLIAGEKVGYISHEDNIHVLDILKNNDVKYISAAVRGGQYKIVLTDKTIQKYEDPINIHVRIGYV